MNFLSDSWIWLYIGAFLMLMELLTPGFVVFFFGLSAASVGLIAMVAGDAFDLTWQLVAFSAFTIIYLLILRRYAMRIFTGSVSETAVDFDNDHVGRTAKVTAGIKPPLAGKIMLGDAEWAAVADAPVAAGADVKVISQKNLTMKVEEIK